MMHVPLGPGAEFDLIRRILERAPAADCERLPATVRVGAGDDCAVVRGGDLALSVDMSVEGVHFRRDWLAPAEIGYRATAAALSDLAAVAATPIGILVTLALPDHATGMGEEVMEGAGEAAAEFGSVLLGGDISRTDGPLVIDVAVIGAAPQPVLRRGARPRDAVWVTGELGAAAAAVRAWQQGEAPEPAARIAFARPRPRIAEALWLLERGVPTSMIDLSDGLAGDLAHIAAASGVRVTLDSGAIPVHAAARGIGSDAADALALALSGGEDYELCFTAPASAMEPLAAAFRERFGIRLTCIGNVSDGAGVFMREADGELRALPASGYDHLREAT